MNTGVPENIHSNSPGRLLLGLDVGGTKIAAIAVDESLSLRGKVHIPTDTTTGSHTFESVIRAIREVTTNSGATPEEVVVIGLGVPGEVRAGVVNLAVNLKLDSFPLAKKLADLFGAPVVLENDVRIGALGVYEYFRKRMPLDSLAYLSVGTGISAGLVLHGQLYRGSNGLAGEVGHMLVEPGGARCNCGAYGCLETVAAGPAIAQQAVNVLRAGQETVMRDFDRITTETVFRAAQIGDSFAQGIIQRASRYLSLAIYGLLLAYDVDIIALGGGVFAAGQALLGPVFAELATLRAESRLAARVLSQERIKVVPRDYNPAVWGAIFLANQYLCDLKNLPTQNDPERIRI